MKKLFALLALALCLIAAAAAAEEVLPRAKSIGITEDEWMRRYNAVPETLATQKTDVFPIDLGITNDRRNYYAEPLKGVSFVLMCEDTTDLVVAASITSDLTLFKNDEQAMESGMYITENAVRTAYASQPDISLDDLNRVIGILDADALNSGVDFNRTCEVGCLRYVFSRTDQSVYFGVCSTETFASEEEFQQYRASSASQVAPATVEEAPNAPEESPDALMEALSQGVQLSPGLYIVGEDFPAGRYQVIVADDVFSEIIEVIKNDKYTTKDSYWLGTMYGGTTANVTLEDGYKLNVTSHTVTLRTYKGILN